ncbi:MAG: corrinoid protein [Desulfobacterales bacterium]|nr:MAG: corrinoid protein [Desulfobacterales bacterium]
MDLLEQMVEAVIQGDEKRSAVLARQAVEQGLDPFQVIQEGCARGMHIVGDRFGRLECYLPEVILAADAMNAAVEVLKPYLMKREDRGTRGTVVLGVIQGDLHDLGKNIVKIMLETAGFTVHDLGSDVPVRRFVEEAEKMRADIIAASAILTTTMTYMPDIAAILRELDLREKYLIMLGGAPVIADWAAKAGADGYGEDALEAVGVAQRLMAQKGGAKVP